jgi:hypothetical protein
VDVDRRRGYEPEMTRALLLVSLVAALPLAGLGCKDSAPPPVAPITADSANGAVPTTSATVGAAPAPAPATSTAPTAAAAAPGQAAGATAGDFYSCTADADCVAVPKNGCCFNGYMEAVNKTQTDAYKASFVCPHPNQMCPHYRINDQRSPVCNTSSHKCEMSDTK